jgi:hypothetical protein
MSSRIPPPYLDTLSHFLCSITLDGLTAEAMERARWIIADCIPVIAAGMQQPEIKAFVAKHLASAASGNAWLRSAGHHDR